MRRLPVNDPKLMAAVARSQEVGVDVAAREFRIAPATMHQWRRRAKAPRLKPGPAPALAAERDKRREAGRMGLDGWCGWCGADIPRDLGYCDDDCRREAVLDERGVK